MQSKLYDTIVIGVGPAGLTAAIYTARAGLKTLVLGILSNSNAYKAHVFENYFGFENQISGPYLMETGKKQARHHGAEFIERDIIDIQRNDEGICTVTDTELEKYQSKTIIIASGLGFKPSGIKREKELMGKGVSFCVTCDGPFFKNKKVALIGAGNFAGEEALMMLSFTRDITMLSHGKDFEFAPKIQEALVKENIILKKTPKIKEFSPARQSSPQANVGGPGNQITIAFEDGVSETFDGVFIALGNATAADFANTLGIARSGNYIIAAEKTGATNIPGVYAAGDCTGGNAQANKSAGEGCNAAISVIKFLKGMVAYVDYS